MDRRIRTGLIGAGAFGANHAAKLASLPGSDFQGVFDTDFDRARALAEKHGAAAFAGLGALFSRCEAVIVATPARTHAAIAGQAIAAGMHVLVEKPLAATPEEAHALVAAAARAGTILQAGHQERFVLDALGLFAAPERPVRIESVRHGPFTGRALDVSATFDLMIHDLDLVAGLFRGAPTKIEARGRAERGPEFDAVEARLVFDAGEAVLSASRIAPERKRTMRAVYRTGEVRVDFLARTVANETGFPLDSDFAARAPDPLGKNVAAFLEAIVSGQPPAILGGTGAGAVELAAAIDAAARAN